MEKIFTYNYDSDEELINKLNEVALNKNGDYLIYKEIAAIYEEEGNIEKANIYKLRAFKNKPSDTELFENLLIYFKEKEDYTTVEDIYLYRVDSLNEDYEKIEILKEVAELERDFIKDIEATANTYMKIYNLNHSVDILEVLEEIYQQNEKWEISYTPTKDSCPVVSFHLNYSITDPNRLDNSAVRIDVLSFVGNSIKNYANICIKEGDKYYCYYKRYGFVEVDDIKNVRTKVKQYIIDMIKKNPLDEYDNDQKVALKFLNLEM